MKYLFTWNSSFLIWNQIKTWKQHFIWKYWDFNLIHIKDLDIDINFLSENLLSASFLSEKKLVILDIWEKTIEIIINFLISNLNKIPDENIIIFNYPNPDKRSKLFKHLKKETEVKEFDLKNESDSFNIIKSKYWEQIEQQAINEIIRYKSNNIEKIVQEIEKLLITNKKITKDNIIENIVPELEESIFQVIDDILNDNIYNAQEKINIILNNTNIYAFYNNLLANLRTSMFIYELKHKKINSTDIWKILTLWNKTFLINKSYKISYKKLKNLYLNLISIDKKMKSWFLVWTTEDDFIFEFQKILLQK